MKKTLFIGLGVLAVSVLAVVIWFFLALSKLPDVSVLKHYRPAAAAEVLDKDGTILTHYYDRKFRIWTPISALSDVVVEAVVTAEDDTFFAHRGVNYKATWDALVLDVQKRRFARGGSTITQQMIKNVLLSKEKTITRKVREYVLATKAEEILSKRKILEIYLNEVEWGENIYGIEAAGRYYLDKHAADLSVAESALLAGMLPNPRYYNPFKRMDKARHRQEQVLFNMQQAKLISQDEYGAALAASVMLRKEGSGRFDFGALGNANGRPCYQHVLEKILVELYGEHAVYRSGMTIGTTLDKTLQDSLRQWSEARPEKGENGGKVLVVSQGGMVRAILCADDKEEEVRSRLESLGFASGNYEIGTAAPLSITREQIIQPISAAETPVSP